MPHRNPRPPVTLRPTVPWADLPCSSCGRHSELVLRSEWLPPVRHLYHSGDRHTTGGRAWGCVLLLSPGFRGTLVVPAAGRSSFGASQRLAVQHMPAGMASGSRPPQRITRRITTHVHLTGRSAQPLQSLHRRAASQFLGHWQGTLGRQPTDEALAALRRARAAVAVIAGGCFARAGATARSQEGSNGADNSRSACSTPCLRPTVDMSGRGPMLYTITHFPHPSPVPIHRQEPEQHSASLWHGLPSSRQLPSPRGIRRAHPPSAYRSAARPSRPTSNTGRHQDGMFTPL
jgi:hypothetical protein